MKNNNFVKDYQTIVPNQAVRSYEGPEEEGRKIRKFSILKPEQELHYSNSTQIKDLFQYIVK